MIEPGVIDTPIWDKEPDLDEFERAVGSEGFQLYWPYLSQIPERIASNGPRVRHYRPPPVPLSTP